MVDFRRPGHIYRIGSTYRSFYKTHTELGRYIGTRLGIGTRKTRYRNKKHYRLGR